MLRPAIVGIGFLAVVAAFILDSSTFQACLQQNPQGLSLSDHALYNHLPIIGVSLSRYNDCLGGFIHDKRDELLTIFTMVLAFSTVLLWVATRDLANEANEASKTELRAYVAVEHPLFGAPNPEVVTLKVENGGQTPAYDLKGTLNQHWLADYNSTLPDDFKYEDTDRPGDEFPLYRAVAVLNPGKSVPFTFPINFSFIERVRQKEIALFFYGHVDYRDAFGRNQTSEFCYQYFSISAGMGHRLYMYDEHNKAT